ncbi:MAG: hypothetical protein ACR2IR_04795 [Acidimicrobiia bacterium]
MPPADVPAADVPEGDNDFGLRLRWPGGGENEPDAATTREAEEGAAEGPGWPSEREHRTDELDPLERVAQEARIERTTAAAWAALATWLDERVSRINTALEQRARTLEEAAATGRADVDRVADRWQADLGHAAMSQAERLDQMMRAFRAELDRAVDTRIEDIRETLNAGGAELEQITTRQQSKFDESVDAARGELDRTTARHLAQLEQSLEQRVAEFERAASSYAEQRERATAEMLSQVQSRSARLGGRIAVALVVCLLAIALAVTALVVGR